MKVKVGLERGMNVRLKGKVEIGKYEYLYKDCHHMIIRCGDTDEYA